MDAETINTLINWFPMLLLIGVWIYFMRRHGGQSNPTLLEIRRQNEILERIATAIEKRSS